MIDDMRDPNESAEDAAAVDGRVADETRADHAAAAGEAGADHPATGDANAAGQVRDTEADILRSELKNARQEAEALRAELADAKDRMLRARAELETFRRRMQGELELARASGLDSAVLPVLSVYDDLNRALEAAEIGSDPAAILPGVRAVLEGLERNLDQIGIRRVGNVGETFDPAMHEALAVVPATGDTAPGTISQVFEIGFVRGDRLVRPARVVVVSSEDASAARTAVGDGGTGPSEG